jgi:hypothetical protein
LHRFLYSIPPVFCYTKCNPFSRLGWSRACRLEACTCGCRAASSCGPTTIARSSCLLLLLQRPKMTFDFGFFVGFNV